MCRTCWKLTWRCYAPVNRSGHPAGALHFRARRAHVSLDGLRPEQGNEQLWVVREVWWDGVGGSHLQTSAPMLVPAAIRTAACPCWGGSDARSQSVWRRGGLP
jgi:hypothetical protein